MDGYRTHSGEPVLEMPCDLALMTYSDEHVFGPYPSARMYSGGRESERPIRDQR